MHKKKNKLAEILSRLLFERKMKPTDLARELELPQPTVHRLVTGTSSNPRQATLEPIADFFKLSVAQLKGYDTQAPQDAFLKTQDNHSAIKDDLALIRLPLIEWDALSKFHNKEIGTQHNKIVAIGDLSEHCFATTLNDSSMDPLFCKDDIIILDPNKTPLDRSYVLVSLNNDELYIFRQLIIDINSRFLTPLATNLKTIELNQNNDKIIGTLVESRRSH